MLANPEAIVPDPGSSLRCFVREEPAFAFDWHRHPEWELTWIERGHGTRFVGHAIEASCPGDLVLLGGDLPHTWLAPTSVAGHRAVVVQFADSLLAERLGDLAESATLDALRRRAAGGLLLPDVVDGETAGLLRELASAPALERLGRLLAVLGRLAQADARVIGLPPRPQAGDRQATARIERACRLVVDHLVDTPSQHEVAAAIGLGSAPFARFFKRHTGRTFTAHVHHLRIAEACALLRESDRSIADIAFSVGFGTLANFNRVFRRICRTTPRAYRRFHHHPG